eukprot:scaffold601_cov170-Ochromonas_danica.AAC.41
MNSGQELFRRWIGEYCAPVVIVTASAEAEKISLRNGLLLHDLLSCFGHLDGINAAIRVPNQVFPMPDGHIRFERVTELKTKTIESVENLLLSQFTPFDVYALANTSSEIKANPPTAWTPTTEQIVMRSMSFSEYEMMSQPLLQLVVVATTDIDPLAAMLELASVHHLPSCLTSGQYDPQVQKVYLLLDDAGEKVKEPFSVLRQLHSRFPPPCTKLISINSFSANSPNFQQPDMWSKFLIPKYFPDHLSETQSSLPRDPNTGKVVFGCRLSVVPALERRLMVLGRQVNDARRGVKNVFKSFWRKPRDESDFARGGLKYRYDKIETQTLLLADTAFMVRDYETAASMYKQVRDEYKADKSTLHHAYTLIMLAACQLITDPHKYRESQSYLEGVSQSLGQGLDLPHANAVLALLAGEMYMASSYGRAPLESARILLQASQQVTRSPLLCGLLIERASLFMLQASQVRRYIFHSIVAGNKLYRCGPAPAKHAMVCFAAALILLEKGYWGDMKTKLARALAADLKNSSAIMTEGRQRALLLLLKVISSTVNETSKDIANQNGVIDTVAVLNDLSRDGGWGTLRVNEGWAMCPARDILLGPLPVGTLDAEETTPASSSKIVVYGLSVPQMDMASLHIIDPVNGSDREMLQRVTPDLLQEMDLLLDLLVAEKDICTRELNKEHQEATLAKQVARIQRDFRLHGYSKSLGHSTHIRHHHHHHSHHHRQQKARISLGEKIFFKLSVQNKLPIDLNLTDLRLEVNQNDHFDIEGRNLTLQAEQSQEVLLEVTPKALGNYKMTYARWNLSDSLSIKQALVCKGPLLQRTLKQRAHLERAEDHRLDFEVVPSEPLLRMTFEGLSPELLQGQLIRSRLKIFNEGCAVARDIFLKSNHPWLLFYLSDADGVQKTPLDFFGCSKTVLRLEGEAIEPGHELQLDVWLRVGATGLQKLSLLAAYSENAGGRIKSSFLSMQITCLPCAKLSVQLIPKISSVKDFTLLAELTNLFKVSLAADAHQPRESSLSSMDRPNMNERHAILDEQGVKMVGLRLLGSVQESCSRPLANTSFSAEDVELKYLTCAGERVVDCFPIRFLTPQECSAQNGDFWLVPIQDGEREDFLRVAGHGAHLQDLVEGFQYLWYAVEFFADLVTAAKIAIEAEELEAEALGPRSIADVRRERQQKGQEGGEETSDTEAETPLSEEVTEKTCSTHDAMSTIQDIIQLEAKRNALSVSLLWVCRWRNKVRWGLHHLPHVGLPSIAVQKKNTTAIPAAMKSLVTNNALHSEDSLIGQTGLQFALKHASTFSLTSTTNKTNVLPVTFIIRSFSNKPITLQVRVKDAGEKVVDKGPGQIDYVKKESFLGLAWSGKVGYSDIHLPPSGETSIAFYAQIASAGVFNVNCFQVALGQRDELSANHFQNLSGESLLFVH